MVEALQSKLRYSKRMLGISKFRKLIQRGVGTNHVEAIAKKAEGSGKRDEKIVKWIMKKQLEKMEKEARRQIRQVRYEQKQVEKKVRMSWRRKKMRELFKVEVEERWKEDMKIVEKTVEYLSKKHGKKVGEEDERRMKLEGIVIAEDWTEEEAEAERDKEEIAAYGVEIDEDERAFLRLPKLMTDYGVFDEEKTRTDIAMMANKIRMSIRKKEDSEDKEREEEGEELTELEKEEKHRREIVRDKEELEKRRIYDRDNGELDFGRRRVTDMKSVRRINPPKPISVKEEAKVQVLVEKLEREVKKEKERSNKEQKEGKGTVLTEREARGRKSLLRRQKAGELVICVTDKSGRLCVMSPAKYLEKLEEHTRRDNVSSERQADEAEKECSAAASLLARVLRLGESHQTETNNHQQRVQSAATSRFSTVPALDLMSKDHKLVPDPPTRAVAKAGESGNGVLSDICSDFMEVLANAIGDRTQTELKSTEELKAAFTEANLMIAEMEEDRGAEYTKVILGSMDVEALFPSANIEAGVTILRKQVLESHLKVNINSEEAALFIVSTNSEEEVRKLGVSDICHTRIATRNVRPGLQNKAVTGSDSERSSQKSWRKPMRLPTEEEKKKMLAIVISTAVKICMKNH